MTGYYFSAENKMKTAQLFIHNLMWGNIWIDYQKFGSKEEGLKYAEELYEKITSWDNQVICDDDDPFHVDKIVDWIYDAITKGRAYGAIKGKLREETYEDTIHKLEEKARKLKSEKIRMKSHRDLAVAELAKITTSEGPIKPGFTAIK